MKKYKYILVFLHLMMLSGCDPAFDNDLGKLMPIEKGLIEVVPKADGLANIENSFSNVHDLINLVPAIEVQTQIVNDANNFLLNAQKSGTLFETGICSYDIVGFQDASKRWTVTKAIPDKIVGRVLDILIKKLEAIDAIPEEDLALVKVQSVSIENLNQQISYAFEALTVANDTYDRTLSRLEKMLNYCSLTEDL